MKRNRLNTSIKILVATTYLAMIAVNALANILPINGQNTGEVSDAYKNLFAPAGITFSIWGLIYLLLAGYTLYQFGIFQKDNYNNKDELLNKIGIYFSISSIANVAWILAWHYDLIGLSMALMLVILCCLILINQELKRENHLSTRDKLFIRLPFSVYFGWITVATIANATTLLVSLDWKGFGISEPIWTIIILVVGMLIGIATIVRNRDIAYGLVIIWAYFGIWIRHTSEIGFAGQYPAVISTIIICLVITSIAIVYSFLYRGRRLNI